MIQVGTPGFSSVPFKKGEKPAVSLPLFTKSADGTTLFHSFKKVDSNLERGPRVDSEEREDGTSYNTTCTLAPGLCVLVFIREEMLKGNVLFNGKLEGPDRARPQELQHVKLQPDSPFWSTDVIPENTIVWLQVRDFVNSQGACSAAGACHRIYGAVSVGSAARPRPIRTVVLLCCGMAALCLSAIDAH